MVEGQRCGQVRWREREVHTEIRVIVPKSE